MLTLCSATTSIQSKRPSHPPSAARIGLMRRRRLDFLRLGELRLARDFATSRAHATKRSTTGLKVRFFKVRSPRKGCRKVDGQHRQSVTPCIELDNRTCKGGEVTTFGQQPRSKRNGMGHQTWLGHAQARAPKSSRQKACTKSRLAVGSKAHPSTRKDRFSDGCPSRIGPGRNDQVVVKEHFHFKVVSQALLRVAEVQCAVGRNRIFYPATRVQAPPLRCHRHRQNATPRLGAAERNGK